MAVTLPDTLRTPPPINKPPRSRLPWPLNLYQTAIGKKWVMGITGLGLVGFVVAHLAGNLKLYQGQVKSAEYAHTLRSLGSPLLPETLLLWVLRLGLIAMFALHIHSAYTLTRMNQRSRSAVSGQRDYGAANVASRSTRITGVIIAVFVVWHLADLTWGWTDGFLGWRASGVGEHPEEGFNHGDPLWNVTNSMGNIVVAIWYAIASTAVAVHLFHGIRSAFSSLGINSPKFNALRMPIAAGIAGLMLVGNLLFPIMVQAGVIEADSGVDVEALIESDFKLSE